ncbi:UDP-N-acetylmuramoyl-L-alanyl-D-glutamate--2,6-diaminopimelate ligase [Planctomycetales bacterium]|nr:UDP-N-acetylmuramoyl-L-alanyl-D-glutamate--2,6-diaminopimelate ligase [Planctomycetales bacterium]GHT06218.1 UDP-N-acetylmuramoyl-L-alanyl-D-glutamate--2,6-diaminopimelate ligase [Planctomycetales bacterium]
MKLSVLASALNLPAPAQDPDITALAYDSRQVRPGALFAALDGVHKNGAAFIAAAIANGAVAILGENAPPALPVPYLRAPNARRALAEMSAAFYGQPSRQIKLLGVTGTNGKTTVAFLLRYLLNALGARAGMLGTIIYAVGGEDIPAPLTTPESVDFAAYLRQAADAGATHLVAEVSSHALANHRVDGNRFAAAVFTNLTRDHLDYHGTGENYAAAKRRLFQMLPPDAPAIVNADDAHGEFMVAGLPAPVYRYGIDSIDDERDWRATVVAEKITGSELVFQRANERYPARMPLPGKHNALNALAALATLTALGFDAGAVSAAIENFPGVPGRLERVAVNGKTAFVDYAHTPDALAQALATLRPLTQGKLWVVFGCGGDRDRGKRPLMAQAAEKYADRIVVTSDNPRGENPQAIIDEIAAGFSREVQPVLEPDRAAALALAMQAAQPADVVLAAGKGHENYQILADRRVRFSDREMILCQT